MSASVASAVAGAVISISSPAVTATGAAKMKLATVPAAAHRMVPTDTPLGLSSADLVRFHMLPRGDRRYGVAWGMEGLTEIRLAGAPVTVVCAAFQWWWEDRQTQTDSQGNTRTTYSRRARLAALVHLPPPYVMPDVRVTREGFAALVVGLVGVPGALWAQAGPPVTPVAVDIKKVPVGSAFCGTAAS